MVYDLIFYLNLIYGISNQLGMVTIITLFHILKTLSPFHSMNYAQVL